jgi:single-strand DNA-binding protein
MPATITIVGNLGRDPETRYTPNGRMNVSLNVAVSHRFRDQSGQQQERTNWFRVTVWGQQAETLDRMAQQGWLVKGRTVFVSGRFEAREYTANDGTLRTSLDQMVRAAATAEASKVASPAVVRKVARPRVALMTCRTPATSMTFRFND